MNYVTGETIKNLREKKRITQKELADMINVSDKTISKWETNKGDYGTNLKIYQKTGGNYE